MLKLRRLEISGFKSFVDPVSLDFAAGVTAIVGPNGCGKSNLSDAISWVLGEQSAKTLRSGTMEDVIFNGSERRRPLGLADVTLTLETDPAFEGAQEGQLTISRRVFRGGEGQYRMNGKRVTLKEIRDLLMGTGLGIRTYSIIEQGKIGLILSGKPQERRRLLEEAAGVTRYRERRRIAEVKLEEATANLLRLDDVLAEVDRAVRGLKRQAASARRYQVLEAEHRELLGRVLVGRWAALVGRERTLAAELAERTARQAELVAGLHQREAGLAAGRQRADALAAELGELHRRDAEVGARIEGRQAFLSGARENLQQVAERLASGASIAAERGDELGRKREAREQLTVRSGALEGELAAARGAVEGDETSLSARMRHHQEVETQVERLRQELLASLGGLEALRADLHGRQLDLERATLRRTHLDEETGEHAHELREGREVFELASSHVGELARALGAAEQQRVAARQALTTALGRESELTHHRQQAEDRVRAVEQRLEVLHQLEEAHQSGRQALLAALGDAGLERPELLVEQLQAPDGWERALDFYFATLADAVVVPAGVDPLAIAAALRHTRDGGAKTAAVLVTPLADGPPAVPIDDPAVAGSLREALGLPAAVAAALPPAFLVDGEAAARRLAAAHPGVAFVCREGSFWRGGLLHLEGERRQPGVLARRQERTTLEHRLPLAQEEAAAAAGALALALAERTERAQVLQHHEAALAELHRQLAVAEARKEDAAERVRRLERQGAALATEAERLAAEAAVLGERIAEARGRMGAREEEHHALEARFDAAQGDLAGARNEREELRAAGAQRQGHLNLLEERRRAHQAEAARLAREIQQAEEQLQRWAEEEAQLLRRREELGAAIVVAEGELQAALTARAASQEEVLAAQERLEQQRDALRLLDDEAQVLRLEHEQVRGEAEAHRLELAGLANEARHLRQAFAEQLHAEPPEQTAEASPELAAELETTLASLAELEQQLAERRAALERIGPVNLLAAQEHDEQEERQTFLVAQREDVVTSVASLKQTIREINATSNERFRATFEEVNKRFGEVFQSLFGGGEAEMRLLDDEDLLESGIEIVARPPGKRLQNLMLLSGGEKALTAIALLVALFHTKASPFCILDEVDAPLDDPNTVRFVEVLKSMSRDTQFLVITHNKLTMHAASTLYGVTMQERGVSKVVGVSLDEVQPAEQLALA
ncbi:MAG TPA: chromosome segregation protein SMC [Thermoanaerobaculia bacterium]|nr:chromosome segregation protein SMC [Thermoanaerobaculia bacterium]